MSTNVLLFLLLPTLDMIVIIGNAIAQVTVQAGWLLPFALLGLVAPIVYLSLGERPSVSSDRRRYIWALTVCLVLVIGLTSRQILIRPPLSRPDGMYDGAVQSEVAARLLLHGINPYGADYRGTPYAAVNVPIPGGPADNVVWHHYIYPPLTFLLFVPLEVLRPVLGPMADYRMITVGALIILSVLLIRRGQSWSERTTGVLLTLGNPLLWGYAVIGANDVLGPLGLIGATLLIMRRKWFLAGIVFGLALATKQTVWIIVPLWACWLWRQSQLTDQPRTAMLRHLIGLGSVVALTYGPFLLWHPARVVTDLLPYAAGAFPWTYPISGTTFLQYLSVFHLIPSAWSVIPTHLFQLLVGIPMLVVTLRWIKRSSEPSRWLAAAAVLSLSVLLVSRYFNNNNLGLPTALLVGAFILQVREPQPQTHNYE